ncbi:hypothetical protein JD844_031067 [Phrynosoma platyrhinos]|uniref:Golgin subfamily A member 7 n=1 Tax=Phrynosoma platyrhinos TaxID=52577 RepID=A0ABQ7T0R2_PHRPL|nr:hypothetical protein JD844_031067 [Phrynosoma platyrhinos]
MREVSVALSLGWGAQLFRCLREALFDSVQNTLRVCQDHIRILRPFVYSFLHLQTGQFELRDEASAAACCQQGVCPAGLQQRHQVPVPDQIPSRAGESGNIGSDLIEPAVKQLTQKQNGLLRPFGLDRQQFEETVRTLNNLYAEAEKLGSQSYLEGCLACLTAYTVFLCMETHYEKVLKKIAKYIQEQNEKIYAPQGLLLTDPIERGLRVATSVWHSPLDMSRLSAASVNQYAL